MSESPVTIAAEVLRCLGDLSATIWSTAEINGYIQSGYDKLTYDSKCLWTTAVLTDVAGQALYNLPDDLQRLDRATWNWRRLPASKFFELEKIDINFRIIQGQPLTYSIDSDGLKVLRKYPVPAANGIGGLAPATGTWGIPRSLADVSADTPTGTWGIPRRTGAQNSGNWGIPREFFLAAADADFRIDYFRRGQNLATYGLFEIPDQYTKLLRFYALHRCYEREGDGQDLKMSQHYLQRYTAGSARLIRRADIAKKMRQFVMGGASRYRDTIPRPQLPWQYGQQVYP